MKKKIKKYIVKKDFKNIYKKEGQELKWKTDPVKIYMDIKKFKKVYEKKKVFKDKFNAEFKEPLKNIKKELPYVIKEIKELDKEILDEYKKEIDVQIGNKYKALIVILKKIIEELESMEEEAYEGIEKFKERYGIKNIK